MSRRFHGALAAGLVALAATGGAVAADRTDRLDRFRELAASRLGLAQIVEVDAPADAFREIYAVLDDEIVDSLASGGPFASVPFLQDRLDTFAEAWGGASLRVVRAGALLIGTFVLDERTTGNSVRVYGRLGADGPAMLGALYREGRPTVSVLPGSSDGVVVVSWEGVVSGWGTRPLRIDVLRREGDEIRVAWSTADLFPAGLRARSWSVRGGEVRIRYEERYPGWAPGCEGQSEVEDTYRVSPAGAVTRVARHEHDGWHRDLHAAVARLVSALAAGDEATLASLVTDRGLRARLPATLRPEPACDARDGAAVSVAAAADRAPWTLTFRRLAAGWRLTGATRVLQ